MSVYTYLQDIKEIYLNPPRPPSRLGARRQPAAQLATSVF